MSQSRVMVRELMNLGSLTQSMKRAVKESFRRDANALRADMRRDAPKGKDRLLKTKGGSVIHHKAGALKRSIRYWLSDNQFGVNCRVGTNQQYAHLVERGTRRSRAKPFLYANFARRKDEIEANAARAAAEAR